MDLKQITAKNITELRRRFQMTQLELGNAIDYSDKAVSKWERGEAVPDAYVLLRLAELFGVSVDYLLHDHSGQALPAARKTNHVTVSVLAVIAVWTLFAVAYISVLFATAISYWLFFVYAAVVSFLLLTIFNTLWGNKRFNMLFIGLFVASLIAMVYCLLLPLGNLWRILILIIPSEVIVVCCFKLKKRPRVDVGGTKKEEN